jgi:hypothetical protein
LGALSEDLRAQIIEKFRRECPKGPGGEALTFPPGSCINAETVWLPVVPLCSEALRQPILTPDRAKMKDSDLDDVIDLVSKRFRAVTSVLISSIRHWQLRLFLKPGPWFIAFFGRGLVKQALIQELGDSYEPNERAQKATL